MSAPRFTAAARALLESLSAEDAAAVLRCARGLKRSRYRRAWRAPSDAELFTRAQLVAERRGRRNGAAPLMHP